MINTNTIFDDVFRTMVEKMPTLVIPVINEVFNEHYLESEKIEHFRNEHQTQNGGRVTDSCLGIRDKLYHIECQSTIDNSIVVRMVEYDFAIAIERIDFNQEISEMKMPRSCVLYLRHNSKTPDSIKMKVVFSNGDNAMYEVPIVKVQNYTKHEIFQKKLLMFLPFYIMKYEGRYCQIEKDKRLFNELIEEYENIRKELDKLLGEDNKSALYMSLAELIIKISDYMLENEKKLKGKIGDIMGGRVLELETERRERMGKEKNIIDYYKRNIISLEQALEDIGLSEQEFYERIKEYKMD